MGKKQTSRALIPAERIERTIILLRGEKVILDADLAALYGISTKRLNEQVKRNTDRFPEDFMFQLTAEEFDILRSQNATAKWTKRRNPPYAFTEHGTLMAANVLKTSLAIQVSLEIVRTFVRLRRLLASHKRLAKKLEALEMKCGENFKLVFEALRQLTEPPIDKKKGRIGFLLKNEED